MTTTTVSAESDWCESQGDAVTQASTRINEKIAAATLQIEAQNGQVFSVENPSINIRQRKEGGEIYYQGYVSASIEWSV